LIAYNGISVPFTAVPFYQSLHPVVLSYYRRNATIAAVNRCKFMLEYEIRVLSEEARTSLIIEVIHSSDYAAVCAARKFAGHRPFEVWRGLDRVFGPTYLRLVSSRVESHSNAASQ
jgi:hypothetical protein